ncbi:MAG: hypothetical protein Q7T55_05125 [Solirubrobacteraceae bacterium]|nr:hypothetical protein [Solirubrobacteraceae bacterium]
MKRSRVPATCAVAPAVLAALCLAPVAAQAAPTPTPKAAAKATPTPKPKATPTPKPKATTSATNAWLDPLSIADAPAGVQAGIVTRLGLTTNGKGTVAWNAGGSTPSIAARDFTVGGTLTGVAGLGSGSLVSMVTRDDSGNVAVAGQSAGAPGFAWIAARVADPSAAWQRRTLADGTYANAPGVFGLKSGFLVATTSSFIPKSVTEGLPTASAFGVLPDSNAVPLGKGLEGVETGDFTHGADGSNWAATSTGHAITTGRRETTKAAAGKAPKSVAALVKVGKTPTRNSILGAARFGGGAVTTVGEQIAVAGLDVQQTNELAVRGVPVVAQGTEEGGLEEAVAIGGVPARRALEVDVAGRAGGGAVVTWLQQDSSRAENLLGQPKWAVVDEAGDVVARGAFSAAADARDLRVVRVGSLELAIWIRGEGDKTKWYAARISGETVRLVKAPAGAPLGRLEGGLNTSQLRSNGRQVALSFVDQTTDTVRVATQTLK